MHARLNRLRSGAGSLPPDGLAARLSQVKSRHFPSEDPSIKREWRRSWHPHDTDEDEMDIETQEHPTMLRRLLTYRTHQAAFERRMRGEAARP